MSLNIKLEFEQFLQPFFNGANLEIKVTDYLLYDYDKGVLISLTAKYTILPIRLIFSLSIFGETGQFVFDTSFEQVIGMDVEEEIIEGKKKHLAILAETIKKNESEIKNKIVEMYNTGKFT